MKSTNRKKAQQIVEFLLIAPFIIGFLAFFTEYAFALNINLTLTKALKESTSRIYQYVRPNMSQDDITSYVKTNFIETLRKNGIPVKEKNNIKVGCFRTKNVGVFTAQYTYYPAFSLPSIFFNFMPDKFNFTTTVSVPNALLKSNNYTGNITTNELDTIWQANTFSSLDYYNGHKNGLMDDSSSASSGKDNILFLIQSTEFVDQPNAYLIVNWNGVPVSTTKTITITDEETKEETQETKTYYTVYSKNKSHLLECSDTDKTCTEGNVAPYDYITNNHKNYIYVVNNSAINNITASDISSNWLRDSSGTKNANNVTNLYSTSYSGILKNTIAIVGTNAKARGSYETNLSCPNDEACDSSTITIYPFGSMIFIDSSSEIRNDITSGRTRPSSIN